MVPQDPNWIAATRTRNFCKGEPLLDFLTLHGERLGYRRDEEEPGYVPELQMLPFISAKGCEFERRVMAAIAQKAEVVLIETDEPPPYETGYSATLDAMARGAEVIAQAVVRHEESMTFGRPDLLVRVDVLSRLFQNYPPLPIAPEGKYVVIDINIRPSNSRQPVASAAVKRRKPNSPSTTARSEPCRAGRLRTLSSSAGS